MSSTYRALFVFGVLLASACSSLATRDVASESRLSSAGEGRKYIRDNVVSKKPKPASGDGDEPILLPKPTSFGYLDVNKGKGSKMYHMFYEAQEAPAGSSRVPIVLWLQVRGCGHLRWHVCGTLPQRRSAPALHQASERAQGITASRGADLLSLLFLYNHRNDHLQGGPGCSSFFGMFYING